MPQQSAPWRSINRVAFPVRCVLTYAGQQNLWRSRWTEPSAVATSAWPGLNPESEDSGVALTSALCGEAWGDAAWEGAPDVVFVRDSHALVAVSLDDTPALEVACDVAEALGIEWNGGEISGPPRVRRGFVELLKLAAAFAQSVIETGPGTASEAERAGLNKVLDAYAGLPDAARHALLDVLETREIDAGRIFYYFLQTTTNEGRRAEWDESESEWRTRWITWLIGQARMDLPYDRDLVDEILTDATLDPDDARLALFQTIRGYDREAEVANASRISRTVAWSEEELIFGRMSRAFHNQALLFAHARYVTVDDRVAQAARKVADAAAEWPNLRPAADRLRLMMQTGQETPLTEMAGALDHLEEQALRHQRELVQQALEERRSQVERTEPDSETDARAGERMSAIMRRGESILTATGQLRAELLAAPRRPAAYLIMSQRPSPTGSHLLAKLNQGDEPFLGKAANLRQLVTQSGDRVYASPDYSWLEHANHWIEAIPLFIKERIRVVDGVETAETVIDQAGMEESFRESMSDPWAVNLRRTELSGWCAIARAMLFTDDPATADLSRQADLPRAWSAHTDNRGGQVAALAAVIAAAADELAGVISAHAERNPESSRLEAARDILFGNDSGAIEPWSTVRNAIASGSDWEEALSSTEDRSALREELAGLATLPLREIPALHVLTTQSANMTDGYVRSWVEECMALFNVVRAHGLEDAVKERVASYGKEIEALGEQLIEELGLSVEVDSIMATEGVNRSSAVRRIIGANRTVQQQVSLLAVLREHARAQDKPLSDNGVDPRAVDEYAAAHADELAGTALRDVVQRNKSDIEHAVAALREKGAKEPDAELQRRVVDEHADYRADLKTFIRFAAREKLLEVWAAEHPELRLREQRSGWLRRHQRLVLTTARKEILTERGLNHLTLDPRFFYQAAGGNKRFHLLYTPSRVDLGPRERESVETWSQWVGGRDRTASQVGRRVYGLINKNVKRFDSLAEPEVLKTGENASMASHFAYSNAMALMVNATGRGDFEELGDQMSLREDRKIHPAGEGYGGYCVPKDGLFLEFVLTLTDQVKLGQLGIEDRDQETVATLANTVLLRRNDFETELEWEEWAQELLADEKALGELFEVRDTADGRRIPVFQITRLATVLDELGQPPLREHREVTKALAARWGVHTMIAGAEHVNRFMPFYKAWLTYDTLAAAKASSADVAGADDAVIVMSAEYKPDTQDGRFAVGMRKYEIYTGTDDHLRYSLGSEAGTLASLMIDGWEKTAQSRGADDQQLQKIARQWGVDLGSEAGRERMRNIFPGQPSPGELRLVSPMGLSTQDVMRYTSDTRIEDTADAVRAELIAAGLTDEDIDVNVQTFGPHLERWARLRGTDKVAALKERIGGHIHALTLSVLGPDGSYEHALQGSDVFDIGIGHKPVLALIDDPARLRDLMLYGRPNSALILVDGGSGARRRVMSRLGVQRWFAACEQRGRTGWYRSIGLGEDTIEQWRERMHLQRSRAERLREAFGESTQQAEAVFRAIVSAIRDDQEALLALDEEERLMRFRRNTPRDHAVTQLLAEVARMDSPAGLTFSHWLALGGLFLLEGRSESHIEAVRDEFARSVAEHFGSDGETARGGDPFEIVRPMQQIAVTGFRQEGGVESSNKATEEVTSIALDTRSALAARARRVMTLRARAEAFDDELNRTRREKWTTESLTEAIRGHLGDPAEFVSDDAFGRICALTRTLAEHLVNEHYADEPAEANAIEERFRLMFNGREFDPEMVRLVIGGYEDIGAIGRLAQQVVEHAEMQNWTGEERRAKLEEIATLAEFVDTAQALETTLVERSAAPDKVDSPALWRELATFFAEMLNDHFYEYRPWAYSRGIGFDEYSGDELYELADRHYRWLYRYLRNLITSRTEVRHLSCTQQDLLLGNIHEDRVTDAIAAEGRTDAERRWRAYNQLREIAFIRNDGFPLPPVFGEFDPSLIDADHRVNILAMYPVGRTHVSRLLAEGPTLARELVTAGQPAANILLTRLPTVDDDRILIQSAHFYIDVDTYIEALTTHWGLNEDGARALARRDCGPKGVRIAARFTKPVIAAVVMPHHGNPVYTSGDIEKLGLPYSVQSRFHTWTTYDKAKYPEIFKDTNVLIPDEIDWLASWTEEIDDEAETLRQIREGRPGTDYTGLEAFAQTHRVVMLKDAAESGGRGAKAFELRSAGGDIIETAMAEAVDFLYQISLNHNVAVQEVIISSPELWATEDFMNRFTDRQLIEWRRPINRDRQPLTPLFGSLRVIMSTDQPNAKNRKQHWHISHRITLNSTQLITNIGRGGTLEVLRPGDIRPEHRNAVMAALEDAGRNVMEAMAAYESRGAKQYEKETGDPVGTDLTGVSYGVPRYLMLDFLLRPVFDRPGDLVEIAPVVDAEGNRIASRFVLHDGTEVFDGTITDWEMILIEPNIGIGLWDRVALREIEYERERAEEAGEAMDWNRVGENARIVLRDLTRAGADYLKALSQKHGD